MTPRLVPFVVVGAIGFVVQIAVLVALTSFLAWPATIATAVSVEAAVLTNFIWHERWTWRDRTGTVGRLERLWRFHLSNGIASIAGNTIVTAGAVEVFHLSAVTGNLIAVGILSAANYIAADRWVFTRRIAATPTRPSLRRCRQAAGAVMLCASAVSASAAELTPQTIAAWNRHVAAVEATLGAHEHDAPLVEPEGRTIDVPNGAIHEWQGSVLVRSVTVAQVLDALLHPSPRPLQEDVAESRVLDRQGDSLRLYLRLVRKVIVTVAYDTEHDVRYIRRSPDFATSRSVSTKITEVGGSDRGFLWRLNSYWRYRRVGRDVQIDVLSLSLSRDVPWMVKPIARPIIDRIGRESMSRTLATTERNVRSAPPAAIRLRQAAGQ